jgi:hypothetical protein
MVGGSQREGDLAVLDGLMPIVFTKMHSLSHIATGTARSCSEGRRLCQRNWVYCQKQACPRRSVPVGSHTDLEPLVLSQSKRFWQSIDLSQSSGRAKPEELTDSYEVS